MIRYGLKSMAWAKSISKWQLHIATCLQHLHNDHSKRFAPSTSSSHRFCSISWLQYGPSMSQMYHWSFKNPKLHEITWIKFQFVIIDCKGKLRYQPRFSSQPQAPQAYVISLCVYIHRCSPPTRVGVHSILLVCRIQFCFSKSKIPNPKSKICT